MNSLLPRRVRVALLLIATGQGVLIIVQADLLARAIAGLDAAVLPWLGTAFVGRAGLAWLGGLTARRAAAVAKSGLRIRLLAKAGRADSGGRFATLVTRGLDALDPYLHGYLPARAVATVVPVLVLARLWVADWTSGLIVLVTLPLVPVFGALVGLRTREVTRRQWAELNRLGGHFRDVLAGLPTLRLFGRTEHQAGEVRRLADAHRRATMGALRVAFLSGFVLELVCSLAVALVAVPVGLRLLSGRLELATALVLLLLTPEAFLPLRALGTRFHAAGEGMAAFEQATALLDAAEGHLQPVLVAEGHLQQPPGEIRFDAVTVCFPGRERPALDRVSMVITPGERIALVGPSGSGKSTLLHLLLGFVTPTSGRILVDGVDLRELDLEAWRRQLAWVPQHPRLQADSVADNIRLGAPSATDDEVAAAARASVAGALIGLPVHGLSAGQPLMLLDEPTARLDLASEAAVAGAADELLVGRTALIVAHRPALLASADRVLCLRDGVLDSERGSFSGRERAGTGDSGCRMWGHGVLEVGTRR
jgi:ATP-binding cassette subfamily C protein CydD